MNLISISKYLLAHPLNKGEGLRPIWRFIKWQVNVRLNPYPIVYAFTEKSKLIVEKGMTGATGNLYCGLHEFQDMGFLLHFLRKEDVFADIGANVGSYTVLASAHIGARTLSFEPVPSTYLKLLANISVNQMNQLVTPYNLALGKEKGEVHFTESLDTANHVAKEKGPNNIQVEVDALDDVLKEKAMPVLLKIDVEGFETEVINGAERSLKNPDLKAIIIELNGSGERYNYDEKALHDRLLELNFNPFQYDPFTRELTKMTSFGTHNTIYIRDVAFVQNRLKQAEKVRIRSKSF